MADDHEGAPGAAPAEQALSRMTTGVFSLDPEGTVLYANETVLAAVGPRLEDVVGRSVYEVLPHLRDGDFGQRLEHALATGEVEEYESFTPRLDRWLRRRLYPSADGVTVLVDEMPAGAGEEQPDALREALERARAAEQRYWELLDAMGEGVKETTPAGHFVVVNDAFATMLGFDGADDLLAHVDTAEDLYVDPEDRALGLARVIGRETRTVEAQMRRRDGGTVWIRATMTPTYSPTGEVQSFRAFVEDITGQRDAERRRRETEEHIEARERTLLAEVVHDEPLQLVVAAMLRLDLVRSELPAGLAEPVEHVLVLLEQTIDRLRNLVVALSPPDLGRGLGEALRALADGLFMGTTTTVEAVDALTVPLPAETQAGAYRILREALVNARKHARAQHVVIGLEERDAAVVLSVADDGVGAARDAGSGGHLGMTSMATRAEVLGSRLVVDSPAGEGTTISLVLPRD